jgi:predicted O-methyltransferase YrrM
VTVFRVRSFIRHWLDAVDEHSLHSPFLYDLYTRVIKQKGNVLPQVEKLRQALQNNTHQLTYADPGAGSVSLGHTRTVAQIVRTSSAPPKHAALYARLADWANARYAVELGTSLGLTTAYLVATGRKVYTFEGVPQLADLAEQHFAQLNLSGIHLIRGNLDQTLRPALENLPAIDFALIDANHRYQPTLQYAGHIFKKVHANSVVVIDDIHLNPDMNHAWDELRQHPLVYCSADLFWCGLLFFNPSMYRQHVVLQF